MTAAPVVLKLGGELLEPSSLEPIAHIVASCSHVARLVVVHGAGREIDAALARQAIPTRQVDGVRVTDAETLDVVISVLAGLVNTRLAGAVVHYGGAAVGLTGADGALVRAIRSGPLRQADGSAVDPGLVGDPAGGRLGLLSVLLEEDFVPVLASLALDDAGRLLNVNADLFAADLAARLGAGRLVIAGGTSGVLDRDGQTLGRLGLADIERLIQDGCVTRGMVVKLRSAALAVTAGVREVIIAGGRDTEAVRSLVVDGHTSCAGWTRIGAPETPGVGASPSETRAATTGAPA